MTKKTSEAENKIVQTETVQTVASEKQETTISVSSGTLIACVFLGLTGLGLFNSVYLHYQASRVHIIDLAGISMTYQEQAKNQGLQTGISDEQRAQILQNYQAKMNTLQQVVEEKVIECHCNIFVKSAILGRSSNVVDMTDEVMEELDKRIPATATVAAPQIPATTPATPITTTLPDEGKGSPANIQ